MFSHLHQHITTTSCCILSLPFPYLLSSSSLAPMFALQQKRRQTHFCIKHIKRVREKGIKRKLEKKTSTKLLTTISAMPYAMELPSLPYSLPLPFLLFTEKVMSRQQKADMYEESDIIPKQHHCLRTKKRPYLSQLCFLFICCLVHSWRGISKGLEKHNVAFLFFFIGFPVVVF